MLSQIFPTLFSLISPRSYIPKDQSSDPDTPVARYANQVFAERPPNANVFRTALYLKRWLQNPNEPLKNVWLTSEQRRKITRILVDKNLFKVAPVETLHNKVIFYYKMNDILQKTYEANPSLDKKEFQNLSAKLEQYSIAALQECMYEHVGLKYLEQIALNYVELNVKEEWQTETWWLAKIIKYGFLKEAWPAVSQVAREQFEKLACAFQDLGKKLQFENDMSAQIEAIRKSEPEERSIQALDKSIAIYEIACDAMFKMPGIQDGLNFYRLL